MKKKNVIIILIDAGRLDRALKSNAFKHLAEKGIFFPQTITYAPYTNSAIHASVVLMEIEMVVLVIGTQ